MTQNLRLECQDIIHNPYLGFKQRPDPNLKIGNQAWSDTWDSTIMSTWDLINLSQNRDQRFKTWDPILEFKFDPPKKFKVNLK